MSEVPSSRPEQYPLTPWIEQQVPAHSAPQIDPLELEPAESILRHYWRMFYRRRWLALAIVAACLALALVISMMTQRQYTATARVQVAREAEKVIDLQGGTDQASARDDEFYATQYALLKSRSLSEAVVRSLRLSDNVQFLAGYDPKDVDEVTALPREERFSLATNIVNENTAIVPIRDSSIVDIQYEAPNPVLAATIANEIGEKFIETNLTRRYESTAYARQFLQNRLNAVRARLEQSERQATAYARQQGLIKIGSSGEGGEVTSEQSLATAELAQLTSQLALARAAREKAEADYSANAGGNAAQLALTNPAVTQLRQQRGQVMAELRKLQSDFGPQYPRVQALQAQVAELNRQIAQEEGVVQSGVAQDLRDRYQQALANERGLQQRVNQLKSAALDQQQRSIQLNIIQRDVDTNRALYDALLQRFKEVGIAGGVGTNNVSIVDRALPPGEPSSPNLPLNLALGLFVGLVLGAGTAVVLEQLAESVILPSEFQRQLGIPLLGSTPATKGAPASALVDETKSELSEAYFSILAALQFSTPNGAPKTISVTSSQAGEGKSTTAMAIARGLAGTGSRVLLIDADLRNPSLHKWLGIPRPRGLSDVLTGHAEPADVFVETGTEGLKGLAAGVIPPNPAELLASGKFESLLNKVVEHFDHVVVDSPPVLGLADAPLIARATEGTVFIVESRRTRATQARHALERLIRVRAHLLGAVLTKLDSRNAGYGYGYGYSYSYGNG